MVDANEGLFMFALVCFLIMLPMIFSVPLLYVGMLPRVRQQSALLTMSVALMIAIACWLVLVTAWHLVLTYYMQKLSHHYLLAWYKWIFTYMRL